jgi:hypothetical protein
MTLEFFLNFSFMDEVAELRAKLAAALEASYAQDEALEETVRAKNLEISSLVDARNAEVATLNEIIRDYQLKEAQWYKTHEKLQISEHAVSDLTLMLDQAKSQIQADLHSISEYSIECPRCRQLSPTAGHFNNSASPVAAGRVKELEDSLLSMEGELVAAQRERNEARKICDRLEREKHSTEEVLKGAQTELVEARKSADSAAEIRKVLEMPLTGSDAEIAAQNARKVAAALVAYCQQLTVQLRSFRKKEKRNAPTSSQQPAASTPSQSAAHAHTAAHAH